MKNKFRHINTLLFGFLTLGLWSCAEEDLLNPGENRPEGDKEWYMPIFLQGTDVGTRSFEYGEEDDSEVAFAPGNRHFAIFYKTSQERPVTVTPLTNILKDDFTSTDPNYTLMIAAIIGKSEDAAYFKNFEECLILVNTDLTDVQLLSLRKDDLLNMLISSPMIHGSDGKEYFTMSNAVYSDGSKVVTGTPVNPEVYYDTQEKALQEAWKGNAAVKAQVERIAAKFRISGMEKTYTESISLFSHIDTKKEIPVYDDEKYSLKVKITGWGMNAIQRENFLFKKIGYNAKYFTSWNDADNYRSYWSEDPNYTTTKYPVQYRRAVDKSLNYYKGFERNGENLLKNFSYTDLVTKNNNENSIVYTPENTYDFSSEILNTTFGTRLPLLAGTHMIVTAEILTNIEGDFAPNDIYRDRIGNFYKTELDAFKALAIWLNNEMQSQTEMKFQAYNWGENSEGQGKSTLALTKGGCYLYYNGTQLTPANIASLTSGTFTEPAEIKDGDGKRVVWNSGLTIKDSSGKILQIITNINHDQYGNTFYTTRDATVDEIRSFIYEWTGALDHFQNGRMYYSIPVYNSDTNIYGVVRNHSYRIFLDGISRLGTSVDDSEEEIVPNYTPVHDQINFSIRLIDWHIMGSDAPFI